MQGTLHEDENRLFKRLLDLFAPTDIVVADRGFSGFAQFATLIQREVELLSRLHQRRRIDWREGTRLGPRDRIVSWRRPKNFRLMTRPRDRMVVEKGRKQSWNPSITRLI